MARPVRRCLTPWPPEGAGEPETYPSIPQAKEQLDMTESKVIVDYGSDIDYEWSEPKNEPVAQKEKEEQLDVDYVNMELPQAGTRG